QPTFRIEYGPAARAIARRHEVLDPEISHIVDECRLVEGHRRRCGSDTETLLDPRAVGRVIGGLETRLQRIRDVAIGHRTWLTRSANQPLQPSVRGIDLQLIAVIPAQNDAIAGDGSYLYAGKGKAHDHYRSDLPPGR